MNEVKGQAVVGRIRSWLKKSEGRLPVSCTVRAVKSDFDDVLSSFIFVSKALRFGAGCAVNLEEWKRPSSISNVGNMSLVLDKSHPDFSEFCQVLTNFEPSGSYDNSIIVADSMEENINGATSIENSWIILARLLQQGQRVLVDLSNLRPKGAENGKGLVASGPASFAKIFVAIQNFIVHPNIQTLCRVYSTINEVLRRGGLYRNGAVTLYLQYTHPEVKDYIQMPRHELDWAKRALTVDIEVLNSEHLPLILAAAEQGDLFLAKKRYTPSGERLYFQVCTEIALKSCDTCLLHHINLGELEIDEIPQAFEYGMKFLCELHQHSGIEKLGIYLPPENSRQVGLGVIGLASALAIHGIKYRLFVNALENLIETLCQDTNISSPEGYICVLNHLKNLDKNDLPWHYSIALALGFMKAAIIARAYGMERAFTIAPTATSSFQYRDAHGFTTTPNIAPPIALNVLRDSQEFGILEADYHPFCEIASEVGFETYFRLCCAWQKLMNLTGMAHAISFDVWDQQPFNRDFVKRWLLSPLYTTYYRLRTMGLDAVDKSRVMCDRNAECESCAT